MNRYRVFGNGTTGTLPILFEVEADCIFTFEDALEFTIGDGCGGLETVGRIKASYVSGWVRVRDADDKEADK